MTAYNGPTAPGRSPSLSRMSRRKPSPALSAPVRFRLALRERLRRPGSSDRLDRDRVDAVIGTREDLSLTGIKRPCARCGADTYTSRVYPDDVAVVGVPCWATPDEDEPGR